MGMFIESKAVSENMLNTIDKLVKLAQEERANKGQLPAATQENPKHVNAISLRSGTIIPEKKAPETPEMKTPVATPEATEPKRIPQRRSGKEMTDEAILEALLRPTKRENNPDPVKEIPPPFPPKPSATKKKEGENEFLDVFGKVSVNIPMLELVTKVPAYAHFLKEFCTNIRKNRQVEQINLNPGVASVCQTSLPEKCKDEGTFSIPYVIGDKNFSRALCDLGGGINMMCLKE